MRQVVQAFIVISLFLVVGTLVVAQDIMVEPRNTASLQQVIKENESGTDYLLIDVRTPEEYESGHIPTAINIDYRTIRDDAAGFDRDQPIIVYCRSGARSARAFETLEDMGFSNVVNFGGIVHWFGETVP